LKHTETGLRSNYKGEGAAGKRRERSQIGVDLRKSELRSIDRALDPVTRITGFHLYSSSDEVQEKMTELLAKRERDRISAANASGKPYEPELQLNAHHAIKCDLWSALPDSEKLLWKNAAESSSIIHHLSEDR
jgi:hypothetical protein